MSTLVALLVFLSSCSGPRSTPDLLLISLDTLRADHLSLYGYRRETSPNLDRFAAGCNVFEHALSSSTWTLPSHATMFSGLLPSEHHLETFDKTLPGSVPTVTELLRAGGYATAAVTDGGFMAPLWGFERGFETYSATHGEPWDPKDAAVVFALAAKRLSELAASPEPFFLFVHSYETHQPYENREGFADGFLDLSYVGPFHDRASSSSHDQAPVSQPDLRRMIDLYDGEIRRLDHYLGPFLEAVRALDRPHGLAVVITSDHGEEFLDRGFLEHALGRVSDANVRVPLLFCSPGRGSGNRSTAPTSTLDIAPTLVASAGLEIPDWYLGRSLSELDPRGQRWVISHGFGSSPEPREEWLRVDANDGSLVVDVKRRVLGAAVRPDLRDRALVALARGRGADWLVLAPTRTSRALIPRDPRVRLVGLIDAETWALEREIPPGSIELVPGRRSALLLRSERRSLLRDLGFRAGDALFRPRFPNPWSLGSGRLHPFEDPRDLELWLLQAGLDLSSPRNRIDQRHLKELQSLGYL